MTLLRKGEIAVTGTQCPMGSSVTWDAVFAQAPDGTTRLIAYVEGEPMAEFFARCLNDVPELVLHLHEGVKRNENYKGVVERAEAFMDSLDIADLER